MKLILDIKQASDLKILFPLLERLGISFIQEWEQKAAVLEKKMPMSRKEALAIIAKGCEMSSFGDPVQFQRKQRVDRNLPFRNN